MPGRLLVFQFDADRAIGRGREKIQHVGGVESDGDRITLIILLDALFRFSVLRTRRGKLDALFGDRKFHGVGALVGELRNAAHGVGEFGSFDHHMLVVVARQHCFVIRELPGQNTRDQKAMADLEEEMALVFRKIELRVGPGGAR